MAEWKELKIDNLPPDILTGGYEFEIFIEEDDNFRRSAASAINVLCALDYEHYRYRKTEPLPPTHEEIMTKWWLIADNRWVKITAYDTKRDTCYGYVEFDRYVWDSKEGFSGMESTDLPPEAL